MKPTDVSPKAYVEKLAPASPDEDLDPAFNVAPPSTAAKDISEHLNSFGRTVVSLTHSCHRGGKEMARLTGVRDGLYAIPGHPAGSNDGAFARPPAVSRFVEAGLRSMRLSRAQAELYRNRLDLDKTVSSSAAKVATALRSRELHKGQFKVLAALTPLLWTAFTIVAIPLNDWPTTSTNLAGEPGSGGTAADPTYLWAASGLIVAIGITVGFYQASRERAAVTGEGNRRGRSRPGDERPRPGLTNLVLLADQDRFVRWAHPFGLVSSILVAGLMAAGGYFRLSEVAAGRMATGVGLWLLWGAAAFVVSSLMTRLSQHRLNIIPAEDDHSDADEAKAAQNEASAAVGRKYIDSVLADQHRYAVEVSIDVIARYYEYNQGSRLSSRDEALDAFIVRDLHAARTELDAEAGQLVAATRTPWAGCR